MLKELIVKLPVSEDERFPIVAARIELPEGEEIGWSTVIHFENGVNGFVTVNRAPIELQNGRKIEDCYVARTGKKLGLIKPKTDFAVYAYRNIIDSRVGACFTFRDIESGEAMTMGTNWVYSIRVSAPTKLVDELSRAPGGVLASDTCNELFIKRASLSDLLVEALGTLLRTVHYSELRSRAVEVSNMISESFIKNGGQDKTGFTLDSFSCGGILVDGQEV